MRLVRRSRRARGVSPDISRAVNRRHAVAWLNEAIERTGSVGLANWMPNWFRKVGSGDLYRLGRLEFMIESYGYPTRTYTNIRTGEVVVLPKEGLSFTEDGYMVGQTTWTTTLTEADDMVVGSPISPRGHRPPAAGPAAAQRVAPGAKAGRHRARHACLRRAR